MIIHDVIIKKINATSFLPGIHEICKTSLNLIPLLKDLIQQLVQILKDQQTRKITTRLTNKS